MWHRYFRGDLELTRRHLEGLRKRHRGSGTYAELIQLTVGHYVAKATDQQYPEQDVQRLGELEEDPAYFAQLPARLCRAVRADWGHEASRVFAELTSIAEEGRRRHVGLLTGGASTARSILLSLAPADDESAVGLRDAFMTYRELGMWAFALADFAAAAMVLQARGDAATAAMLLGARTQHSYRGDASQLVADQVRAQLEASLGEGFDRCFEEGALTRVSAATDLAVKALDSTLA